MASTCRPQRSRMACRTICLITELIKEEAFNSAASRCFTVSGGSLRRGSSGLKVAQGPGKRVILGCVKLSSGCSSCKLVEKEIKLRKMDAPTSHINPISLGLGAALALCFCLGGSD